MMVTGLVQSSIFSHTGGVDDSNAANEDAPQAANDKEYVFVLFMNQII